MTGLLRKLAGGGWFCFLFSSFDGRGNAALRILRLNGFDGLVAERLRGGLQLLTPLVQFQGEASIFLDGLT